MADLERDEMFFQRKVLIMRKTVIGFALFY